MNNQARPTPSSNLFLGTSDAKICLSTPAVPLSLPSIQDNKATTCPSLFRPRKNEVHPFAFAEEILAMIEEEDADEDDTARRLAQACQA